MMDDKGFQRDLLRLKVNCIRCDWKGLLKSYPEHLDKDHTNWTCEYCNEIFLLASLMDEHKKNSCSKIAVACVLVNLGCSNKLSKSNMSEHFLSELHQRCLLVFIHQIIMLIHLHMNNNSLTELVQSQGLQLLPSLMTVTSAATSIVRTTTDQTVVNGKVEEGAFNLVPLAISNAKSLVSSADINDFYGKLSQNYETLMVSIKDIQILSEDSVRLSTESLRHQNILQSCQIEINQIKQSVDEKDSYIAGIAPSYEILQQETSSMKQKVDDLQSISLDGTLIWKITNVSENMVDAQSERQTSIYSPPFYSSRTGYKMRARLYLHGDGNARRTHMSLFFVIMRGVYDAILTWPFNFKVTFCLFDLSGQQQHIIDSFRPDIKSNSFQRPRSEMNIASGIPKFIPLSIIQQDNNSYIRDNTMYIKVIVDFEDTPKMMLSYALTLNSGLPHHIQQSMMKQEVEKRQSGQPQPPMSSQQEQATVSETSSTLDNFNHP